MELAATERTRLRRMIKDQEAIIHKLEGELSAFKQALNARVVFFAVLGEFAGSTVTVEVADTASLDDRLRDWTKNDSDLATKAAKLSVRSQRLQSIADARAGQDSEGDRECIICTEDMDEGVILECSHIVCSSCYKVVGDCPICKTRINHEAVSQAFSTRLRPDRVADRPASLVLHQIHRFRLQQELEVVQPEDEDEQVSDFNGKGKAPARAHSTTKQTAQDATQLSCVSLSSRNRIAAMSIKGSWGSKVSRWMLFHPADVSTS